MDFSRPRNPCRPYSVGTALACINPVSLITKRNVSTMIDQLTYLDNLFANGSTLGLTVQVLDSLGSEGLSVTPTEPNDTMLKAGSTVGGVSPEVARRVYQVMLMSQD